MASYVSYLGNGSTTDFAVPFPYLRQADVVVKVNGVVASVTWLNAALVRLSPAPANGATVLLSRATSYSAPRIDWQDNAAFKAADLRTDTLQALYAVEEARDAIDLAVITSGGVPTPGAANVGKVLRASGAATFGWADETAVTSKISTVSNSYSSAGLALSTSNTSIFVVTLPNDTASVLGSGFFRGDNQSATAASLVVSMQLRNASNVVQSTTTVGIGTGAFGNGRFMQSGLTYALALPAGNTGWNMLFRVALDGAVSPAFLYDLYTNALCVTR